MDKSSIDARKATQPSSTDDGTTLGTELTKKPAARTVPKWEQDVRERLKTAIRKFSKPLADLMDRDANEGDTRLLVTDFLCEVLGFDKYLDLTTEYLVRGEFADYGIRIEKELISFIEVKRITTKLDTKHLRQVEMYAVNEGVEWIILTNGENWKVYHLAGGPPQQIVIELVLDINLLGEKTAQQKADQLFYLTRESLKRHQIDELWESKKATSPQAIGKAILSAPVIAAIQKELRRQTKYNIEANEINHLLTNTILRPECFTKSNMASLDLAAKAQMASAKQSRR